MILIECRHQPRVFLETIRSSRPLQLARIPSLAAERDELSRFTSTVHISCYSDILNATVRGSHDLIDNRMKFELLTRSDPLH